MSNPLLGSLTDQFTGGTLNAGLWNMSSGGGVNGIAAPGRAYVQVGTGFNNIGAASYNASGQAIYARVTPAVAGTGGKQVQTFFQIALDGNNLVQIICTPGTSFQAQVANAGVYTTVNLPTYDPAQHAWWRLRETGGSWAVEASADGAAWTTLTTLTYAWSPASVAFYFLTHTGDGTTGGNANLEHVNTPLGTSPLMPSWPQVRFQVAFNTGGTSTTPPAYVDLSSRLRGSWSAALAGRQYELDQVQSGQMTLTLWNGDGALDPLNTSSPYSPNVVPMRAARLQAVWPPTRNLIPQDRSNGVAPASAWYAFLGTASPAKGLAPAPTGHTTALGWQFPITGSSAGNYPLITGPNAGSAEATSFPVVAGQSYAFSSWISRSSGGDATVGVLQDILWYDKTGAQIGLSSGTLASVPVQPVWAQNVITGTAPAGAVVARVATWLTNTSTTAVNTLYFTAMQLEQATAPTPWTAGGVVYPLWAGFVERFPQQWDFSGTYGLVDLTCVDLLAGLAQFTLAPNFQASLQALGPDYMYPFNDASGSTRFVDATGHRPARNTTNSALGAGSATVTAGNSLQGGGAVGVAGPVTTITNPTAGGSSNVVGRFIGANVNQVQLPSSGGWTRLICFRTTAALGTSYMTLWATAGPAFWSGQSGSQAVCLLGMDQNGHGFGWVTNAANTASATVVVPDVVCNDGNWHILVAQLSADGKTFTVAVDQHGYQSSTTLDFHPTGMVTEGIGAQENHYIGAFTNAYTGDVAFATQFATQIGNSVAFDLMSGFSTGWSGETSAARAQRILNLAGYGGTIQTQGATLAMGGANFAGTDPMSALTLVGDTEAGQVYVDGAGQLWLTGRLWRYLQTNPTVTFGENQGAGEVPYLGDVAVDFDTTHIYNAAQVTQVVSPGFPQPPVQPGNNTASQQAYLPRTIQRSINTQDQTLQQAAAQYLVSQYGQPLPRLAALNVDPASNPALWSTVLGLGFGTRAQVNRRPPSGPGAAQISVQQFVEHLTWTGDDQGNLKFALQLTPAAPYLNWGVVASLHTTVQVGVPSGQPTLTLGALTGSATNPASAVLAPGTVLTVGYGTANAENLTVKSVGATSPGYAAVAVTFTTSTVNPHNLNEVVCQPLPGGYQLPAATAAGFPASLDGGATISATGPRAAY